MDPLPNDPSGRNLSATREEQQQPLPVDGNGAGPSDTEAPPEAEDTGPVTEGELEDEEIAEELDKRAYGRYRKSILRVSPLTTDDLSIEPPPKERYPVRMGKALRELWRARELMFTLVERDLRVRYKQAFLGGVWAVIQPLMLMVVFSVVFGKIARVGSEGLPYPVFAYSAIVPFSYFSSVLTSGMGSIVNNFSIVKKMYVPREVFPLSNVFSGGFDFAISCLILLIMIFAYGIGASVTWVAFPLLVIVLVMIASGLGMLAGAFTAYWRDSRYAVPLLIQVVMYGSPIAYPVARALKALGPGIARVYMYVNPLAPIMDGFRRILLHHAWPQWGPFGVSAGVGLVLIVVAYRVFKRLDPTFSDVV